MKQFFSTFMCFCLAGCASFPLARKAIGPSPGVDCSHQDAAPLPWISVIPSKRAIEMKGTDFERYARDFRYLISIAPYNRKFGNVRLVLMDYTILPAESSQKDKLMIKYGDQSYSKNFSTVPERYMLKISCFKGNLCPPHPPSFEGTFTMPKSYSTPYQGIRALVRAGVEDLFVTQNPKIHVDL